MNEMKLVEQLTDLFKTLNSSGDFVSLKMWTTEENKVKFFITNNPPKGDKDNKPNDVSKKPACVSPSVPPLASSSPPSMKTRAKKRKVVEKIQPTTSPETLRYERHSKEDLEVSIIEDDRTSQNFQANVPCSNRFNILNEIADEEYVLEDGRKNVLELTADYVQMKPVNEIKSLEEYNLYRFCNECDIDLLSCHGCDAVVRKQTKNH